jgi:hypothetical protein
MNDSIRAQIEEIQRMTVRQLREKYREVFQEESRSNHRQFLIRKIAWRLQANAEGGLSERARRRALEIANDADLRIRAPEGFLNDLSAGVTDRTVLSKIRKSKDSRVPKPGTDIVREFKGKKVVVRILEDGFEYEGHRFRSLSAIASQVTGTRWNGFLFFGLNEQMEERIA